MKNNETKANRSVLTIAVALFIIYILTEVDWLFFSAISIALVGSLSNYLAVKIDFIWMKISWLLGQIVPKVLLTVIYFIFLFPIAMVSNLFGRKNSLHLKNTSKSMFINRRTKFDKISFEKPW